MMLKRDNNVKNSSISSIFHIWQYLSFSNVFFLEYTFKKNFFVSNYISVFNYFFLHYRIKNFFHSKLVDGL